MSTPQHDFSIVVHEVTPNSRPMKPLGPDHVIKVCRPCGVSWVAKKTVQTCPHCKTPFDESAR